MQRILEELRIRFQAAIERHRDSPGTRKDFRIFDRHFVANGVRSDRREAFNEMQRFAVEIAGPVEPVLVVEIRHIDDQRIPLPAADRMTHLRIVGRGSTVSRWIVRAVFVNSYAIWILFVP